MELSAGNSSTKWQELGNKSYELSNHLGNVLATISDKPVDVVSNGVIDHYEAEVLSAQDYYPFGMLQPDRKWSLGSYRYGFNGKENDNEVKGEGNQQDYGMRVYDPRLGKFLSVDPLTRSYPELTPYQFASNRPIDANDLDGAESSHWDPVRGQWMMPSDAIRHPLPPGAFMPSNDAARGGQENAETGGIGMLLITGAVIDAGTGFTVTRSVLTVYGATQAASIVAHNKAKTPEAVEDQNRQGKEALAETLVGVGAGYTFKILALEFKGLYNFVKTKVTTRATPELVPRSPMANSSAGGEALDLPPMHESRLRGRELIVDENISPSVITPLEDAGFSIKSFPKGTQDIDIINYAKKGNSIVLTNNIKDFRNSGVTAIKVTAKQQQNHSTITPLMKILDTKAQANPSIISPGKVVSLANPE
jgi:RHS repeat-associated protein